MKLKLGVIMDPIQTIRPDHDSTFAMLCEAQQRGWSIAYMEQRDLFLSKSAVWARVRELQVFADKNTWFKFNSEKEIELQSLDVILMRKDPPVDSEYLYVTQLLSLLEQQGTLVVNKPQSLRDFNEKLFIFNFPQCIAPTEVTSNAQRIKDFLREHGDIIGKPLGGMAGQGIFRLRQDDPNVNVIIETLTQNGASLCMVQKFIPEIRQGDKRILLIDGEPVPHALARMPAVGETRANMAVGGKGVGVELSERDRWICKQIGPTLRQKGLLFAGIDVIGDYLTEINVTSPTGLQELDRWFSINISGEFLDCIEKYIKS